eukprot:s977_g11.t1
MPYKHSAGLLAAPAAQWDSCRNACRFQLHNQPSTTQSTIQFEVNQQECAAPLGKLCAKINTQLVSSSCRSYKAIRAADVQKPRKVAKFGRCQGV